MKKILFSAASVAITAAIFSSCSSDDKFIEKEGNEPLQVITMTVANTGDNFLGTRAASDRDLFSSDALQSIENVHVVIYKLDVDDNASEDAIEAAKYGEKTIVAHKLFTDWMNGGVSTAYSSHGREASWTLKSADIIREPGTYLAYAVGYNTDNYTGLDQFHKLVKEGEDPERAKFNFPVDLVPENQDAVKEIFAGSTVFKVTNEQKADGPEAFTFNASLTLHRQVAGTIGYFANIPLMGNKDHESATGRYLRLVAADKNSNIVFAGFNSDFETTGNKVSYYVNGYMGTGDNNALAINPTAKFYGASENNAYTVYEVDLKEWFPELDSNGDGILNEGDNWNNVYNGKANVAKGSVLAGKFIVPFLKVADKATFQLQMLDADQNIIRYWNIRLPQAAENAATQVGKTITVVANNGTTSTVNGENVFNYSIVRNHLYNIGVRNNGDNPGNPGDPDTPGDKPQDLNNETLVVKVNDNWEVINELDVD